MIILEEDQRTNRDRQMETWLSFHGELKVCTEQYTVLFSAEEKEGLLEVLIPHFQELMDHSFLNEILKEAQEIGGEIEPGKGFRSLVEGVRELQRAWPSLNEKAFDWEPRLNDLCGFLFATLPLAEEELRES